MTKTQKLLAAMLVSLGMAHGVAFAQVLDGTLVEDGGANGAGSSTTTINSGHDNDNTVAGTSSGNVVIRAVTATTVDDGLGGFTTTTSTASSLTIGPNGAEFKGAGGSGPVKVTGVANGTTDFDAVNYRQLKEVAGGVASVAAMANIPQIDQRKKFSMGAGVGTFQGQTATAIGASVRLKDNLVARASVGATNGNTTAVGVGVGYSW